MIIPFGRQFCRQFDRRHIVAQMAGDEMSLTHISGRKALEEIGRVGEKRAKEQDQKSELVLGSTYQIFEWDRNNSDRNFDFWETNRIVADRIF